MKKILIICFSIFCILTSACQKTDPIYKIGDRGPGGGIIFAVLNGNKYSECSEDLGRKNWNEAVFLAKNYNGGGLTDWRLPDRIELYWLYINLKTTNLDKFHDGWYWSSSTDNPTNTAWGQNFLDGNGIYGDKKPSCWVRAVRTFKEKRQIEGT